MFGVAVPTKQAGPGRVGRGRDGLAGTETGDHGDDAEGGGDELLEHGAGFLGGLRESGFERDRGAFAPGTMLDSWHISRCADKGNRPQTYAHSEVNKRTNCLENS